MSMKDLFLVYRTWVWARNSQFGLLGPNWEILSFGARAFGACSEGPQWGSEQSPGKY